MARTKRSKNKPSEEIVTMEEIRRVRAHDGRKGGMVRAERLSAERRREIARNAGLSVKKRGAQRRGKQAASLEGAKNRGGVTMRDEDDALYRAFGGGNRSAGIRRVADVFGAQMRAIIDGERVRQVTDEDINDDVICELTGKDIPET